MYLKKIKSTCIAFVIITLTACNKESGNNGDKTTYYIKAKINNQEISYKTDAKGRIENNTLSGAAFKESVSNFPSFSFDLESTTAIKPGIYNESSNILIFRYSVSGTETFHSQMGNEEDFSITITEITTTSIKGTFNGTIRKATAITNALMVENGEFILQK